jgi:peptidoglycan/LPS O-acetylase OafA/YrhL
METVSSAALVAEGPAANRKPSEPEASHRQNSFDIMRFLAACAVIIGHHAALNGDVDPALPIVKDTLPGLAVCVFFCISGYLIFNSLKRDPRAATFFAARMVRLVPNLLFSLVVVSMVMMIWFDNYRNLTAHLRYVWNNTWMFSHGVQYTIPGILEGRPLPGPNGSLWTLPYEFWMYVVLFGIFLLRESLRRKAVLVAFFMCAYLWITASPGSTVKFLTIVFRGVALGKLGTYFFAGALVAAFWPAIAARKRSIVIGFGACGAVSTLVLGPANPVLAAAIALLSIMLGRGMWGAWFNKGDPSYGMYIFGFPVQQLTLLSFDDFFVSLAVALAITIAVGYATYWAFERRCIAAKLQVAEVLRWPFR